MKISLILILFCASYAFGFESPLLTEQQKKQTVEFLNQQGRIRVLISNSPGMGHTSMNLEVIKRLRELGYSKKMDVVYRGYKEPSFYKLERIFPGFQSNLPTQYISKYNIDLIHVNEFAENPLKYPQTKIAMTGATDRAGAWTVKLIRADIFLRMAPAGWGETSIYTLRHGKFPTVNLPDMPVRTKLFPSTVKPLSLLETNKNEFKSIEQFRGLKTFYKHKELFDYIASYGHIEYGGHQQSFEQFSTLGMAAKKAQEIYGLTNNKPIVISLISRLDEDELSKIQENLGKKINLETSSFKFVDINDKNLAKTFKALKRNDVLFLRMGLLPAEVFDYLFTNTDILSTTAGANAQNLLLSSGRAYLNSQRRESNLLELIDLDNLGRTSFDNSAEFAARAGEIFINGIGIEGANSTKTKRIQELAYFISQAKNEDSQLNHFYQQQSLVFRRRDKVEYSLYQLKNQMELFEQINILKELHLYRLSGSTLRGTLKKKYLPVVGIKDKESMKFYLKSGYEGIVEKTENIIYKIYEQNINQSPNTILPQLLIDTHGEQLIEFTKLVEEYRGILNESDVVKLAEEFQALWVKMNLDLSKLAPRNFTSFELLPAQAKLHLLETIIQINYQLGSRYNEVSSLLRYKGKINKMIPLNKKVCDILFSRK